jgi:hypothetical protein
MQVYCRIQEKVAQASACGFPKDPGRIQISQEDLHIEPDGRLFERIDGNPQAEACATKFRLTRAPAGILITRTKSF